MPADGPADQELIARSQAGRTRGRQLDELAEARCVDEELVGSPAGDDLGIPRDDLQVRSGAGLGNARENPIQHRRLQTFFENER